MITPSGRPIDASLHPLATGHYRIATPAIQAFYQLVTRCLQYRITGALTYGPPRIGKTRAIEYVRLLLAEKYPKITTFHAQAEHKPRHAEGSFFTNLLEAVGYPDAASGTNPAKRIRLTNKIKEAATQAGSGTVVLFCDESQRYNEHEYEWLRDVHDRLDRLQIKLFTFLVGQQELLSIKTALQHAQKTQIVARLMVEELKFSGIRNANEVAICLHGYDQTMFPAASGWSFTRFWLPQAFAAGYRLVDDAQLLWSTFEALQHQAGLPGPIEIPMESFTRTVEIVLKDSELRDSPTYRPPEELWRSTVRNSGYLQARIATASGLIGLVSAA